MKKTTLKKTAAAKKISKKALVEFKAELAARFGVSNCPTCKILLDNGVVTDGDEMPNSDGSKYIKLPKEFECMACGAGFGKATKHVIVDNSAGVARSWTIPAIRNARTTRHMVTVGKELFSSTHVAFKALGLPDNQMTKFRKALKIDGKKTLTVGKKRFNFAIA